MNRFERRHVPRKPSIMSLGAIRSNSRSSNNSNIIKKELPKKKINNDEIVKISNFSNVRNMGSTNGTSSLNDALIEAKLQSLQNKYDNRIIELEAKVIEQSDTIEKMNTFFDTLTKNLKTQTFDNFKKVQSTRKLVLALMSKKAKDESGINEENFLEKVNKTDFLNKLDGDNIEEQRQSEVVIKKVGAGQFGKEDKEEKEKKEKAAPTKGNGYFSKSEALKNVKKNSKLLNNVSNESDNSNEKKVVKEEVKNEIKNQEIKSNTVKVKEEEKKKPELKPVVRKRRRRGGNRVVLDIKE